jgi:hypothetical protein
MRNMGLFFLVILVFVACDDIIEVVDISDKTVAILAPTNGSVVHTTLVNFSWQALEDAETYRVQVVTPTFNEAAQILLDTIVTKTYVSGELNINDFEWRVKAVNSGYETPYTTQHFSVIGGE